MVVDGANWRALDLAARFVFGSIFKVMVKACADFFGCLFVAFSTSHVRLPHYLHPTYMILAPIGAYTMWQIAIRFVSISELNLQRLRWSVFAVLAFAMVFFYRGSSGTADRGQEFVLLGAKINALPMRCEVYVRESQMERYRMESFSLWYLHGRGYQIVPDAEFDRTRAENRATQIWWDPDTGHQITHPSCKS